MYKLLIVEDELNLGTTLQEFLTDKGYHCDHAPNATQAQEMFKDNKYSIVLMDINLPDGDGIELAKTFRMARQDFVLLFLSAQNDPETKYQGLEMGAEDYITKPFDLRELTLRLDKALKTHNHLQDQQDEVQLGKLRIFFKRYLAIDAHGKEIPLGQKECAILELLYSRKNEVVSRDEIIESIWGKDVYPSNRTVDNYIVKLRKWLETDDEQKNKINSIRGVGYKFEIK